MSPFSLSLRSLTLFPYFSSFLPSSLLLLSSFRLLLFLSHSWRET